jgi:hypothetical protein
MPRSSPQTSGAFGRRAGRVRRRRTFELELKLMADAALVGFPNAGKSTFISASRQRNRRWPTTRSRPSSRISASCRRRPRVRHRRRPRTHRGAAHRERARSRVLAPRRAGSGVRHPPRPVSVSPNTARRAICGSCSCRVGGVQPRVWCPGPGSILVGKADLEGAEAAAAEIDGATLVSPFTGDGLRRRCTGSQELSNRHDGRHPTGRATCLHRPVVPPFRLAGRECLDRGGCRRTTCGPFLGSHQPPGRRSRLGSADPARDRRRARRGRAPGRATPSGSVISSSSTHDDDDWYEGEEE